jgi:hypothetical protein
MLGFGPAHAGALQNGPPTADSEGGELELDADIRAYVPEFPAKSLARWFASGPVEVGGDLDIGVRGIEPGASSDIGGFELTSGGRAETFTFFFTKQSDGEWLLTDVR